MLSIAEVYELFDKVGCCSFATLDGKGGVDSRIAHFFAHDENGLYLRTMTGKPFYRQMVEGGKLSVCGEVTAAPCEWDEDNMPHFQPGYMVRVSGDVRELSTEETDQLIKRIRNLLLQTTTSRSIPKPWCWFCIAYGANFTTMTSTW